MGTKVHFILSQPITFECCIIKSIVYQIFLCFIYFKVLIKPDIFIHFTSNDPEQTNNVAGVDNENNNFNNPENHRNDKCLFNHIVISISTITPVLVTFTSSFHVVSKHLLDVSHCNSSIQNFKPFQKSYYFYQVE